MWPVDWRGAPEAGDRVARVLQRGGNPVLVRLWFESEAVLGLRCRIGVAGPVVVDAATAALERALPSYRARGSITDLGGEFLGVEAEGQRSPRYLSVGVYLSPRDPPGEELRSSPSDFGP